MRANLRQFSDNAVIVSRTMAHCGPRKSRASLAIVSSSQDRQHRSSLPAAIAIVVTSTRECIDNPSVHELSNADPVDPFRVESTYARAYDDRGATRSHPLDCPRSCRSWRVSALGASFSRLEKRDQFVRFYASNRSSRRRWIMFRIVHQTLRHFQRVPVCVLSDVRR